MQEQVNQAAERLRRLAVAKQAMPVSDAETMVREFVASFIAGDNPVKHQNTMELFQASLVLAGAWLDSHLPDDNIRLDSDDWHEYWHSHKLNIDGEIIVSPQCSIGLESTAPLMLRLYVDGGCADLPHVQTRRQLRQLLRALGVSDE